MKKTLLAILIAATLLGTLSIFVSFADFGSGVAVMASETKLIKTGLLGKKLSFSDTDFKQGLCISDFDHITVTRLPKSTEGALMLGGRRVGEGAKIRRKNIASLVFIPQSKEVSESSFSFKISPYADGDEIEFILRFTDRINYEPELEDSAKSSIMTQRDVTVFGSIGATDPEGDNIEYMILEYPRYGKLELTGGENGEFCYTPPVGFVGEESFRYVVRDEYGNFSKANTVSVSVSERMTELEFHDLVGKEAYNAALTLSAMGIMNGRIIGDSCYFCPDESVTKAEFVAMLMKTLSIPKDSTVEASYFDDDADIPDALRGYVATAQMAGFIDGEFTRGKLMFNPNEPIELYEAASIITRVLGKSEVSDMPVFLPDESVSVSEKKALYTVCELGIFKQSFDEIKKGDVMTRGDLAMSLYSIMK